MRTRETLFVGRWGLVGPELYMVGKRVRRLASAQDILAEVMYCRPARQLARAFAAARLEPLPPEGFVLSASDVEAWLDGRDTTGRI